MNDFDIERILDDKFKNMGEDEIFQYLDSIGMRYRKIPKGSRRKLKSNTIGARRYSTKKIRSSRRAYGLACKTNPSNSLKAYRRTRKQRENSQEV